MEDKGTVRIQNKIKLLILINSLYFGGAEKIVVNLVKNLNKNKYKVFLGILESGGELEKKISNLSVPLFNFNRRFKGDISVIFKLFRFLRKNKIDIIHTHLFGSNFYGRLAAILAETPVVISTEHGGDKKKKWWMILIDYFLSFITNKVVIVSNSVKKEILNKKNLVLIPNGVSIDANLKRNVSLKRESFNLKKRDIVVGFVGRLVFQKNVPYLFEAVSKLKKENIKILIIGDGPLDNYLKNYAKSLSIYNKILFLGYTKNVSSALNLMDIFVLPSYREGCPLSLLEAMAHKKPVIVTDIDGNNEIVTNNKSGFVIPLNKPEIFAEKLSILSNSKILKNRFGNTARKLVEQNFSLKRMVSNYEKIYDKLYKFNKNGI